MKDTVPTKYGQPLTGSDWAGLPLRIGHIPETGHLEDLHGRDDAVLVWSGGPSRVTIKYDAGPSGPTKQHAFERSSGMIDLLPRSTRMHTIDWVGKTSTCISVNFPPACLSALSDEALTVLDEERGPEFGLLDSHVVDLVHRLREQVEGATSLGAVYIQSLSLALASYVSARFGQRREDAASIRPASLSNAQRDAIERFVEAEMESNFGLVDLAQLVGYCPDHFSRLFKQSFQLSPYQYVLKRRIDRAMSLLRDEQLTIAEIASECGFADQGHLTKAFKQRVGLTPGAYRRK